MILIPIEIRNKQKMFCGATRLRRPQPTLTQCH
jgi:hypothetical protein